MTSSLGDQGKTPSVGETPVHNGSEHSGHRMPGPVAHRSARALHVESMERRSAQATARDYGRQFRMLEKRDSMRMNRVPSSVESMEEKQGEVPGSSRPPIKRPSLGRQMSKKVMRESLRRGAISQRDLAMATLVEEPDEEVNRGQKRKEKDPDRWHYFLIRVFGIPAMYASSYRYMTVDEGDESMNKTITKWTQLVIHPLSLFRKWWDLLVMVLVVWNIIVLPVRLSFYWNNDISDETGKIKTEFWIVIDIMIDLIFLVDVLLNFNTGYLQNLDQVLIMDRKRIAKHYLRGWFTVDLVSSIPLDLILLGTGSVSSAEQLRRLPKIFRIVKLSKLLRLLRVTKVTRYLSKFDILSNISSFLLRMIRLLTVIALFSHWNACIQFLLPAAQDFPSRCWPLEAEILADSAFQQYSWSLFRALSQMLCIGYGSPGTAPLLAWEAWMVIISMVFGAVLFAILVGIITTMLVQLDEVNARHRNQLMVLNQYMLMRNLPLPLRMRVRQYHEFRWSTGKFMSDQDILNMLPSSLRTEIALHNVKDIVDQIPFLQNADRGFISAIATKLEAEVYLPGDRIIGEGEIGEELFFIKTGAVQVSFKGIPITVLGAGSYFGEIAVLKKTTRTADVEAIEPCELFRLGYEDFNDMMVLFPESRSYMGRIAEARLAILRQHSDGPLEMRRSVELERFQERRHSVEHSRRPDLEAIVAHREAEAGPGEEGQGQEAADAEWSATMLEHLGKLEAYMPKVQEVFGDALGGRSSGVEGLEEAAAQLPGRKESQDMFISIIGEMKQRVEALARMEVQLNKQASLIQLEQNRISRAAGHLGARSFGASPTVRAAERVRRQHDTAISHLLGGKEKASKVVPEDS